MATGPITSWQIEGEDMEAVVTYSTDVTCLSWVGGKVPSYGEWKAGHQEEGLYCIYMWSLCGEVWRAEGEAGEELREEA